NGLDALDITRPFANRAWRAESSLEGLLDPFPGDGDEAEIVERQNLVWRTIDTHGFFEGLHHLLTILALVHIDEVDHDDAAEIAQTNLANDLFDGVGIDADD